MRNPSRVVVLPIRLTTTCRLISGRPRQLVAEHAVLDLVPLAGSGREMTDLDRQPQLVGEFLQLSSP